MSDRRSFLRGLATLPMIGGSVALIGSPSAAAVPVTDELLRNYDCFLAWERRKLVQQVYGLAFVEREPDWFPVPYPAMQWHYPMLGEAPCPPIETRAAVVLAAVGCPLTRGFNV